LREDATGPTLSDLVAAAGMEVRFRAIVPDERDEISRTLIAWSDQRRADLILTAGGTGLAPRDVTPEATLDVLDRTIPGIAEAMRSASLQKTPHAMLSRAVAGVRGKTLIINLPGSPRGAKENLEAVLSAVEHAAAKIQGDPSDCA
jgi:molybdenum cofactor synthesis domain-containing protein